MKHQASKAASTVMLDGKRPWIATASLDVDGHYIGDIVLQSVWELCERLDQVVVCVALDTDTMAQNQGGVLKIPLSTFFDTKQLVMAHPDLLAGADVRVVDNGTLALGVDLVGGDAPNVGNWQQFTGDFRGEHDWAASVSRTVLQQFFDQKLAGALHDNQADRSAPYTLDSLVGTWGNPIRVHGHGAAHDPDCGDIHFRLELEVRLSIGTDHHLWLSTQLVDFSVDYWDGAKAVICHGS